MHSSASFTSLVTCLVVASVAACTGATDTELDDIVVGGVAQPTEPVASGADTTSGGGASGQGQGQGQSHGGGNGGGAGTDGGHADGGGCAFQDGKDHDGDGLSFSQGDCNDCNANVRPGFSDLPANGLDEDCSGKADDEALCDDGLSLTSTNAFDAAKAIGLCSKTTPQSPAWGVLEAKWSKPDGTVIMSPESWGLLAKLGPNVAPSGKAMLALSTGAARAPSDPDYEPPSNGYDKDYSHGAPDGQPKPFSACPAASPAPGAAHDGVALELKIRVPLGAKSMSFTHQFFTADTGEFVCSQYNDVFVAMMDPKPAGLPDGNIVFDSLGDPVGINSTSLLRACTPGTHKGLVFACPLGTASLVGTGFDDKAATGWLRTTVPVTGGSEITLKLAIWDSGDGTYDSTVLVDDLGFSPQPAGGVETVPR